MSSPTWIEHKLAGILASREEIEDTDEILNSMLASGLAECSRLALEMKAEYRDKKDRLDSVKSHQAQQRKRMAKPRGDMNARHSQKAICKDVNRHAPIL